MAKATAKKSTRRGTTRTFTDEERAAIKNCVTIGIPQKRIAEIFDCSINTLHKHCRKELDLGMDLVHAEVAGALVRNATDLNNVTAQIFWLKTKGGWREEDENANAPPGVLNINLHPTVAPPAE